MTAKPTENKMTGIRPENKITGAQPENKMTGIRPENKITGAQPENKMAGAQIEIKGVVDSIVFCNNSNGFTVCMVVSDDKELTAVGCMPGVYTGETLLLKGRWVNHPDYGQQLSVEAYEKTMPDTINEIIMYLSSGVIKGIGLSTARKIVEKFGTGALEIIDTEPDKLCSIKGINPDKAKKINEAYSQQKELTSIVMFFQKYGISPAYSTKIYKKFGAGSINIISTNPYRLAEEVVGISFGTADRIAMQMGIDKISQYRIKSGIKFALSNTAANGHVYYPAERLKIYTKELLEINISDELEADMLFTEYNEAIKISSTSIGGGYKVACEGGENSSPLVETPIRKGTFSTTEKSTFEPRGFNNSETAAGNLMNQTEDSSTGEEASPFPYQDTKNGQPDSLNSAMVDELIEDAMVALLLDRDIFVERYGTEESPEKRVYSGAFHTAENLTARKLAELALVPTKSIPADFDDFLEKTAGNTGLIFDLKQREAVIEAITNSVTVITGGPGTGKTTIIRTIISFFFREGKKIALAAPTGRAAKRMTEATGFEAKTIHRLLETGYNPITEEPIFARDESNPLDADVIIIDEMSMVDILLMYYLLKAVRPGCTLILAGDSDQLPSVGPGNVLRDIISSGVIKTVRLTEIFRQAGESMIIINAHRINSGLYPVLNKKGKDFFFMQKKTSEELLSTIVELCSRRLPESFGYDPVKGIQVLTPSRKGAAGVINLNVVLQKVLNPPSHTKNERKSRDYIFREGDKIMQTRNNYTLRWEKAGNPEIEGTGVFNGDTGIISCIDNQKEVLTVLFEEDKLVEYDFSILDELEHAFALTVHKSQGSEFPCIIIPVFYAPNQLLNRNLLYTAVTRARELAVLVGVQEVLAAMVENVRQNRRYTGLSDKLRLCLEAL